MVPQESWESREISLLVTTLHFINGGSAKEWWFPKEWENIGRKLILHLINSSPNKCY